MTIVAPRNFIELQTPPSIFILPYHIAFIVDGVVENIMHLNEDFGNLFLSNPTMTQIESNYEDRFAIQIENNEKTDVMELDERSASILLSNPIIKQVNLVSDGGPDVGHLYNIETDTFSLPN